MDDTSRAHADQGPEARRGAAARTRKPPASVDAIAERVLGAIMEHRLPPGTKLVEERLAGVFGVSRTKIRQALARLAHDNVLTIYPNRGTFVASPSVEEARNVFNARRLVEPGVARAVASAASPEALARLRDNTALESASREVSDRRAIIRLSGEFHILLAELTGNPFIVKSVRELALLTCLIIALYDSPHTPACPYHEHGEILESIARGDGERAAALMVAHLDHVERALDLHSAPGEEIDLEAVFA
ncbi:MAG TPA: GntR family transcriptional regulator [Casimicrobiaceae bacterium]